MITTLPYTQGVKAFQYNLGSYMNLYDERDCRYRDWLLGYSNAEQGKNQMASVNVKCKMLAVDP